MFNALHPFDTIYPASASKQRDHNNHEYGDTQRDPNPRCSAGGGAWARRLSLGLRLGLRLRWLR